MLKDKDTIVFDLDGTLADTMHIFADVATDLISTHYALPKEEARKKYFETSGHPFHKQLEMIFGEHELNSKIAPIYEIEKIEATKDVKIDDEEYEALQILKNSNFNLVISSNNFQQNIDHFVNNNNLHELFMLTLGLKDDFSKGTPHFNHIMEELGVEERQMVFIGDSISDAKAARENNIDFIGKVGTFNKKEFSKYDSNIRCIEKINELIG